MLFALSPQAEQALERDFARHAITRKYLAIVQGHLTEKRTIESYLVRDRGDGKRGSSPLGPQAPESQRALTHVTPIETIAPKDSPLAHSIVECQLETGRTHQIRIHLSELGHPLAGEKTYLPPPTSTSSPSPLPPPHRHALHSAHLRLTHPITGHTLEYHSDLPKDLATWLKRLRDALRH
jgi:23S rRNA pseudouridine1911/1915/1917 synthase